MFLQETGRGGLKVLVQEKLREFKEAGATQADFEEVMGEYNDKLQKFLDHEDELDKNADVDDLASRFEQFEKEAADFEHHVQKQALSHIMHTADESQARHMRQIVRMTIVRKIKDEAAENMNELLAQVNDDLAQRILDKEYTFDETLKPFVVKKSEVLKMEKEVLRKNNASYFKAKLEEKAMLLRSMTNRAEGLMHNKGRDSQEFVAMVIAMANKTKRWSEARMKMPKPYSITSLMAVYNQACLSLYILGVFSDIFPKTIKGIAPWFIVKPTHQGMVEVKQGSDWSEDLRTLYYEVDDGNRRTPVRGSGVDG